MGGKRLAAVSGVSCLSKEGWRGYWGGYGCWWKAGGIWLLVESGWDTVAGGKRVGYVWDLYVQAFHVCLFCL